MIPFFELNAIDPQAVAMVSEVDGVFIVEPMQFLYPGQARARARRLTRQAKNKTALVNRIAGRPRQGPGA